MGANVILKPYESGMRDAMAGLVKQGAAFNLKAVSLDDAADEAFERDGVLYRVIFDADSGEFLGECDVHDTRLEEWEIGIKVVESHWGEGVASSALSLFLAELRDSFGRDRLVARIMPDNVASIGLFRKFGAEPRGIEPSDLMRDESVAERFAAEASDFIDGPIKDAALLFGVEQEEILGSVLVFDVPTDESKWGKKPSDYRYARRSGGSAIRNKQEQLLMEGLVSDLERIAAMDVSDEAGEELRQLLGRCKRTLDASDSRVIIRKVPSDGRS